MILNLRRLQPRCSLFQALLPCKEDTEAERQGDLTRSTRHQGRDRSGASWTAALPPNPLPQHCSNLGQSEINSCKPLSVNRHFLFLCTHLESPKPQ